MRQNSAPRGPSGRARGFVCIGRPSFEALAERQAADIARETGTRSILLMPIPVFAEAILRILEGTMVAVQLGDVLARESGVLTVEALPERSADVEVDREGETTPTSAA